jgi:hypothetical protein
MFALPLPVAQKLTVSYLYQRYFIYNTTTTTQQDRNNKRTRTSNEQAKAQQTPWAHHRPRSGHGQRGEAAVEP